mgnify:FL=1
MPIYEYQCEACSEKLEALQKISDAPLVDCPTCGEAALKKLVSAAAFRLKGGGWYETDFKTGDKKKNLVSGSDGNAAGGKSSDGSKSSGDSKSSAPAKDSSKSTNKGSNSSSAA